LLACSYRKPEIQTKSLPRSATLTVPEKEKAAQGEEPPFSVRARELRQMVS
jgi:hypothetical protein